MRKNIIGYIIAGIIVVAGILSYTTYNTLVKKEEKVKLQWNEVQNVYQRRLDLIPNLVNTVKGGADFEKNTLQKIAEARAAAVSGITASEYNQVTEAQNQVAAATNRLLINVENYPELQGTRAFADLQVQLEGTERRIKFARTDFNTAIANYNSTIRSFPANVIGGMFGFSAKDGFTSDPGADKAVEINFKR